MIRVQSVLLPILRDALPGATIGTWLPGPDQRELPYILLRRAGGSRHDRRYCDLSLPVVSMTVYSNIDSADAETLYDNALEALYASVRDQKVVPGVGYLSSLKEASGASEAASPIPDTWAVTGQVRLGLRPIRSCNDSQGL